MFVVLLIACVSAPRPADAAPSPQQVLSVALYPWVPNPESFFAWIENDFESKNKGIDLVVRTYDPNAADLSYDIAATKAALTSAANPIHLVEVDTLILGALVDAKAVVPFDVSGPRWIEAARQATTVGGTVQGVPHWTCGYFIITKSEAVAKATSAAELRLALDALGTGNANLAGDIDGKWDTVAMYLDAYEDTTPTVDLVAAVGAKAPDQSVVPSLKEIAAACMVDGKNHCDVESAATFANGGSDALVGYSERLNAVLSAGKVRKEELRIASAPFGAGDHPLLFTDALVLSPQCDRKCRDAATTFARYYTSDETYRSALLSGDVGDSAVPRYLLPATWSAFDVAGVAEDPLYRQLKTEVADAKPLPNRGVPEAKEDGSLRKAIWAAMFPPEE